MADLSQALMNAPPGTDPVDYAKLLRQQQIAQIAQEAAITPVSVQQPQGSNKGFYQAARVSPIAGLSKIAEAMLAKRATDQSNTGMANAYAKALQAFTPGGGPPVPPPTAPALAGYGGGAGDNDAGQPGSTVTPKVNPMNPFGQDPRALAQMYMTDKTKYLEMVKGTPEYQNMLAATHGDHDAAQKLMGIKAMKDANTPEWMNAMNEAGGDPVKAQQIMYAKATKDSTVELRSGNTNVNLLTGEAQVAPNPTGGEYFTGDPLHPGPAGVNAVPIGGSDEIKMRREAMAKAATEGNTPREFTRADGSTYYAVPSMNPAGLQAPETPSLPSINRPGAPAAPAAPASPAVPKQFFPTSAGSSQTTSGKEYSTASGKSSADYGSNLADDSNGATEVRRSLAEMRNLAKSNDPNALNSLRMKFGQMAIAAGVSPDTIQRSLGIDTGALEAAKKQTSGLAVASIHQMTSRGTNFDLETFMENNPNMLQTQSGYQRVIDYMDSKSRSIIDKHAAWDKYVGGEGKSKGEDQLKSGFTAKWNASQNASIDKGDFTSKDPAEAKVTLDGVEHEKHGGKWYTADEWAKTGR